MTHGSCVVIHDLFDAHHFYLFSELESVNPIAISQEIFRSGVEGKSFDDLLCGPLCSWMNGHVEMDDPSAIMREHDKDEQNLKLEPDSVYGEEVDRNQLRRVISEERFPCL